MSTKEDAVRIGGRTRTLEKWAAELGEPQVAAIESVVIERLRKSLPDLAEDWPPA